MRYKVHLPPCISGIYDIYSRTSELTFNKNAIEGVTRSVFTNCSIAYLNLSRLAITHGEKKVNLNGVDHDIVNTAAKIIPSNSSGTQTTVEHREISSILIHDNSNWTYLSIVGKLFNLKTENYHQLF